MAKNKQMAWSQFGTKKKIDALHDIFVMTYKFLGIKPKPPFWDDDLHRDEPEMLRYIGKFKQPSAMKKYQKWLEWYSKG